MWFSYPGYNEILTEVVDNKNINDAFIKEFSEYMKSDSFCKDQTLFLITTDNGRGIVPLYSWNSHGAAYKNSD